MELALNGVPQAVGYKVSRVTSFLARKVLNFSVEHISPVNLILQERLVPELIQDQFTPQAMFEIADSLLQDQFSIRNMLDGYQRLIRILGEPGVTKRAANEILDFIEK